MLETRYRRTLQESLPEVAAQSHPIFGPLSSVSLALLATTKTSCLASHLPGRIPVLREKTLLCPQGTDRPTGRHSQDNWGMNALRAAYFRWVVTGQAAGAFLDWAHKPPANSVIMASTLTVAVGKSLTIFRPSIFSSLKYKRNGQHNEGWNQLHGSDFRKRKTWSPTVTRSIAEPI